MKSENTAVILSVGTELTEGTILNTHFRFLGAELKGLGFHVLRSIQIPDDRTEFRSSLSQALNDCNLVILTGGLGPTSDDLSREIVAEVAGVVLDFHSSIWEDLVARYGKGGPVSAEKSEDPSLSLCPGLRQSSKKCSWSEPSR
jgi:nicotinamide-nucleotide amidase